MIVTVRTILHVGDSLRSLGSVPSKYKKAVRGSLTAQYPGVTGVTLTETRRIADNSSGEPYTVLTAEGQWDDGKEDV